jgi:hypothetical protein
MFRDAVALLGKIPDNHRVRAGRWRCRGQYQNPGGPPREGKLSQTYSQELTLFHPCILAVGAWLALTGVATASDLSLAAAAALRTKRSASNPTCKCGQSEKKGFIEIKGVRKGPRGGWVLLPLQCASSEVLSQSQEGPSWRWFACRARTMGSAVPSARGNTVDRGGYIVFRRWSYNKPGTPLSNCQPTISAVLVFFGVQFLQYQACAAGSNRPQQWER